MGFGTRRHDHIRELILLSVRGAEFGEALFLGNQNLPFNIITRDRDLEFLVPLLGHLLLTIKQVD